MDPEHISNRIKTLRVSAGMSQNRLADRAGIRLQTVQRIENGDLVPREDTLRRIAHALQVDPGMILEGDERQGRHEWQLRTNKGYLHLMNISMLGILINPVLWILLPIILWLLKKEKSRIVDETGKKILDFQITLIVLFFSIPILASWFLDSSLAYQVMSDSFVTLQLPFGILPTPGGLVTLLLVWNFAMIAWNAWRIQYNQEIQYFPVFPFYHYLDKLRIRMS